MNVSTWEKLPAIEGKNVGCENFGPRPVLFPPNELIAVGFGYAALHRDGIPVWMEADIKEDEIEYLTGEMAEEAAAEDPDHDWRIILHGHMAGRVYQRNGAGEWVLIEQKPLVYIQGVNREGR